MKVSTESGITCESCACSGDFPWQRCTHPVLSRPTTGGSSGHHLLMPSMCLGEHELRIVHAASFHPANSLWLPALATGTFYR